MIKMEDELHACDRSDNAIKALSILIRRTRAGLKDPRTPRWLVYLASFNRIVGKTELAALANSSSAMKTP